VALILDTGPLLALIDRSDPDHERCAQLLTTTSERRIVPLCVLVDVEYLLRPWPGGFTALMTDVSAGRLETHFPDDQELARAAALVDTYADLPLGFVTRACSRPSSISVRRRSRHWIAATSASRARRTWII